MGWDSERGKKRAGNVDVQTLTNDSRSALLEDQLDLLSTKTNIPMEGGREVEKHFYIR
jgi:hypothetical protein